MNVILLFGTCSSYASGPLLQSLKQMYLYYRGTTEEFEIIYISLDCDEAPTSFESSIVDMPWLVHAHIPDFAISLLVKLFEYVPPPLPAIATFGRDGHLVTMESNLLFKNTWNNKFPFIQESMEEEVLKGLRATHKWDLRRLFFPEPRPEPIVYRDL